MKNFENHIDEMENTNRKPKKEMTKKEKIERAMGKLIFGGHCNANTKNINKFARQLRYMERAEDTRKKWKKVDAS